MSLFDMCCPRKPKKSLDYVIKWVENTDKTVNGLVTAVEKLNQWKEDISEETLKPIFDEYAENYPWDSVPEFNAKADKVENATVGHLAALDSSGNLVDSGSGIGESIEQDNMDLATCNAVYMALQGFAPSTHSHSEIKAPGAFAGSAYARIYQPQDSAPVFTLKVGGANDQSAQVTVNVNNIENLQRALEAPDDTPASGSDNLITSNAVYGALSDKASSSSVNSLSARIDLLESYLLTNKCTIQVDITRGYDGTNYYYIIKNGGNNVVSASTAEYVTLQNIDDIFRLAKTGDTIGITTRNGNVILSGTISEKSLGAIKVSSAFDDQYVETFSTGTGTLTLSVSTQS